LPWLNELACGFGVFSRTEGERATFFFKKDRLSPAWVTRGVSDSLAAKTNVQYRSHSGDFSLAEAKPIAALSRTDGRELEDELQLHQSVMPMIEKHRDEWDN
jgi:hypothetical protein